MAAVLVIAAIVTFFVVRGRRRSERLRSQFDREYDWTVAEYGNRSKAEKELEERLERVEQLSIRPLPPEQRDAFTREWEAVQARFVDDPATTVGEANRLVQEVMAAEGYPVGDFERQAADISPDRGFELSRGARGVRRFPGRAGDDGRASTGVRVLPRAVPGAAGAGYRTWP